VIFWRNEIVRKCRERISTKYQRTRLTFAWLQIRFLRVISSRPILPVHCPCCHSRLSASQKQWTHSLFLAVNGERELGWISALHDVTFYLLLFVFVQHVTTAWCGCVLCRCEFTTISSSRSWWQVTVKAFMTFFKCLHIRTC